MLGTKLRMPSRVAFYILPLRPAKLRMLLLMGDLLTLEREGRLKMLEGQI